MSTMLELERQRYVDAEIDRIERKAKHKGLPAMETECCCECGSFYPKRDLVEDGQIYCVACRPEATTTVKSDQHRASDHWTKHSLTELENMAKNIVNGDSKWPKQATDESGCVVAGVGPEAPTVTNEKGAKQSGSPYRCDLLPAQASLHVAGILKYGADKYGDNNWRGIPIADHLNHALTHIFAWLAGDSQDDHLGHAACRLMMALEVSPRRSIG